MNVKDNIRQFLLTELKELGQESVVATLTDDTSLLDGGIIDSVMILSLLSFLEENYGIFLSNDELKREQFTTIQTIHDLVIHKTPRT